MRHSGQFRFSQSRLTDFALRLQAVQQVSYLLSVCHVLLVIHTWPLDESLLKLVRACERIRPRTASTPESEIWPEIGMALPFHFLGSVKHFFFILPHRSSDDTNFDALFLLFPYALVKRWLWVLEARRG